MCIHYVLVGRSFLAFPQQINYTTKIHSTAPELKRAVGVVEVEGAVIPPALAEGARR